MTSKTTISRTIQYWRLVDARNEKEVDEYDWDSLFRRLIDKNKPFPVEGKRLSGTIRSHASITYLSIADWCNSHGLQVDPDLYPLGIILSSQKDFVPNQEENNTGKQLPVRTQDEHWTPVDNLFVYHLPFGNIIAVLAESVSSTRATKYAGWLNKLFHDQNIVDPKDPEFAWKAAPVIDPDRIKQIHKSKGLKKAEISGRVGTGVSSNVPFLARVLGNVTEKKLGGIKVSISVSIDNQASIPSDRKSILHWFDESLGELGGIEAGSHKLDKAYVESFSENGHITEIDLIQQRITRKAKVKLQCGDEKNISYITALDSIHEACAEDIKDLFHLRSIS